MHAMPAASVIARSLVALARTEASGALEIRGSTGERAFVTLERGRLAGVALEGACPRIGELVGAAEAAAQTPRRELAGSALVRAGLVGQGALVHALRTQVRARLAAAMAWPRVELRFDPHDRERPKLSEPIGVADAVLAALRDRLARSTPADAARVLGTERWALSPLGDALTRGAALWPDEAAVCAALRHPVELGEIERACGGSPRGVRMALALAVVDAAATADPRARLALLARKAREVRRSSPPRSLLELPRGGAAEARRALRRLASELHPDRLDAHAPEALRALSNEVMGALGQAARQLGTRES